MLYKIPGDKVKYLHDLSIEYLATSRRWAEKSPLLLKKLNQAGIKIFAFHVNLDWWVFAMAGLIAIGIALTTVVFQSARAAMSDPVESIRSE